MRVAAAADLVRSAISPLVANAVRHAGSRAELAVAVRDGRVQVTVVDDGAGVSAEDTERCSCPATAGRTAARPAWG